MARTKKRPPKVEELRPDVEGVAQNLGEKLYGPQALPGGPSLPRSKTSTSTSAKFLPRRCST
jgi:hypothetical protein